MRRPRRARPSFAVLPIAVLVSFAASAVARAQSPACVEPRTALVLSGGGARGLAHVGVLRALDSLGIRPDLVVGTSMGSVVGALYASGYSGRAIDSLARVLPLQRLFRAFQPVAPRSLDYLQPLVEWEQRGRRLSLQTAAVHDPEMNALLSALLLRGNLVARGSFDSLPIPFRAVATDLATRGVVVLSSGDLARAVRASVAIPLLFTPERIDGRALVDGGLSANVPVAVARAAGAQRVIVSDATSGSRDTTNLESPLGLAAHLIDFLFSQRRDSLGPDDVRLRMALDSMTTLDFGARDVARAIAEGRTVADSLLRPPRCPPRAAPARAVPTRLAGFDVRGVSRGERAALRRQLGFSASDTVNMPRLRRDVRALADASGYTGVWLGPRGAGDSVRFDVDVERAPVRIAGAGIAYDHELGGRAWAGYADRRLLRGSFEGSVVGRVGSLRQDITLSLRRNYPLGGRLFSPVLLTTLSYEDIRRFDAGGAELSSRAVREGSALLGVEHDFAGRWSAVAGVRAIAWHDTSRVHGRAAGAALRVLHVTGEGERLADASAEWNGEFQRVALDLTAHLGGARWQVQPRLRLGVGDALPLQALFPLGGDDGFPGLHIGERRGDREAYASTVVSYPVLGRLRARIEVATGSTALGGAALPVRSWLVGARGGLSLDTPLGPIRAEYGRNSLHRGAVLVRFGRWF